MILYIGSKKEINDFEKMKNCLEWGCAWIITYFFKERKQNRNPLRADACDDQISKGRYYKHWLIIKQTIITENQRNLQIKWSVKSVTGIGNTGPKLKEKNQYDNWKLWIFTLLQKRNMKPMIIRLLLVGFADAVCCNF